MYQEKEKQYIAAIRKEYEEKDEQTTKLEQLQNLNDKVRRPANIFAYVFGIIGTLILGIGLCLAMKVIGGGVASMIAGIIIGIVGIGAVSSNYFIYKKIMDSRKKKYAKQVLELSDELLNV